MDLGIKGKKVIVTAASKGLGFASAKILLMNGAKVIISSSNEENLKLAYDNLKNLGELSYFKADLSNKEDIDALFNFAFEKFNSIDILVYVTGSPKAGKFMELKDEDWNYASNLLLLSAVRCAKRAAELMKNGGRIIFSASAAIKEPIMDLALSNVIRISIAGLVKTLSKELASKGILVNAVLPGYIFTDRVKQIVKNRANKEKITEEEALKSITKDIPLGRIGDPEEFANVVLFLASNLSSYVNGACIPVDGGMLKSVF
jgi:3-oxoacyl-[acyl-carrier protein] reductase